MPPGAAGAPPSRFPRAVSLASSLSGSRVTATLRAVSARLLAAAAARLALVAALLPVAAPVFFFRLIVIPRSLPRGALPTALFCCIAIWRYLSRQPVRVKFRCRAASASAAFRSRQPGNADKPVPPDFEIEDGIGAGLDRHAILRPARRRGAGRLHRDAGRVVGEEKARKAQRGESPRGIAPCIEVIGAVLAGCRDPVVTIGGQDEANGRGFAEAAGPKVVGEDAPFGRCQGDRAALAAEGSERVAEVYLARRLREQHPSREARRPGGRVAGDLVDAHLLTPHRIVGEAVAIGAALGAGAADIGAVEVVEPAEAAEHGQRARAEAGAAHEEKSEEKRARHG